MYIHMFVLIEIFLIEYNVILESVLLKNLQLYRVNHRKNKMENSLL